MNSFNSATDVARDVAKQTESLILEQLNDFVKRGLVEIESGPISFVDESPFEGHKVTIRQTVKLRLKDREYIEKLESENKIMRETLKVSCVCGEMFGGYEAPTPCPACEALALTAELSSEVESGK